MYKTILVTLDVTPTAQAIIEPGKRLAKLAQSRLVLADIFLGSTASRVQYSIAVPVLLLRAK